MFNNWNQIFFNLAGLIGGIFFSLVQDQFGIFYDLDLFCVFGCFGLVCNILCKYRPFLGVHQKCVYLGLWGHSLKAICKDHKTHPTYMMYNYHRSTLSTILTLLNQIPYYYESHDTFLMVGRRWPTLEICSLLAKKAPFNYKSLVLNDIELIVKGSLLT